MTNYERGRKFENYVKSLLRGNGFEVVRCAGSKPVDLIAFKPDTTILIECKARKATRADILHCQRIREQFFGFPFRLYSKADTGKVVWQNV
jgi:Holliday junction resolvase